MKLISVWVLVGSLCVVCSSTLSHADSSDTQIQHIRLLETDDFFAPINLDGVAFPPNSGMVLRLPSSESAVGRSSGEQQAAVELVASGRELGDQANMVLPSIDPATIAFDAMSNKIYVFAKRSSATSSRSITTGTGREKGKIISNRFGVKNPVGMSVDPTSQRVFILDAADSTLYQIDGELRRSGATKKGDQKRRVNKVKLVSPPSAVFRGLAYNAVNNQLYTIDTKARQLYSISENGELLAEGSFADSEWREPAAMAMAPSLDQTDDPSRWHLFIASSGLSGGEVHEWRIPSSDGEGL